VDAYTLSLGALLGTCRCHRLDPAAWREEVEGRADPVLAHPISLDLAG
jgi:hypothetical protein